MLFHPTSMGNNRTLEPSSLSKVTSSTKRYLRDKVMRKEVQEALESAIAGFEKRQRAEQERLRERGVKDPAHGCRLMIDGKQTVGRMA
jgi:hypothetical protein